MIVVRAMLALLLLPCFMAACQLRDAPGDAAGSGQRGTIPRPADVRATPALNARLGTIGREARADEIRLWDIDVNPAGVGLPQGRGTHASGARVYARECASCHGAQGEGIPPNPKLVGVEPREFVFGRDPKAGKTIGNYWPYATTLYDYINRAMPFATPGSLSADDLYGVVAWLLAENQIIERTAVMDRETLPKVRMPARDRFVRDDRTGGPAFR